jgi:hypothetical protein
LNSAIDLIGGGPKGKPLMGQLARSRNLRAVLDKVVAAIRLRHSAVNQSAVHAISFADTMTSYPMMARFALRKKSCQRSFGAGLFFNLMQINSENR